MSSLILKSRQGFTGQIVRTYDQDTGAARPACFPNKGFHFFDPLCDGAAVTDIHAEPFSLLHEG